MSYLIASLRVLSLASLFTVLYFESSLQPGIDAIWSYLKGNPAFKTVYFETCYNVAVFWLLLGVPSLIDRVPYLNRYKLDKRSHFDRPSYSVMLSEIVVYTAPLAVLDTVIVKKYAGVDAAILQDKRSSWLHYTRDLPEAAPSISAILLHVVLGLVLYDFVQFFYHLLVHKNAWLYRNLHAKHHNLEHGVHARLTHRQTVIESVLAVYSFVGCLNLIGCHPFTRTIFVVFLFGLLIESHSPYDFPFSYDKVLPFGIGGGSKHHYQHHLTGRGHYAPFFTYLDTLYEAWSKEGSTSHKKDP